MDRQLGGCPSSHLPPSAKLLYLISSHSCPLGGTPQDGTAPGYVWGLLAPAPQCVLGHRRPPGLQWPSGLCGRGILDGLGRSQRLHQVRGNGPELSPLLPPCALSVPTRPQRHQQTSGLHPAPPWGPCLAQSGGLASAASPGVREDASQAKEALSPAGSAPAQPRHCHSL